MHITYVRFARAIKVYDRSSELLNYSNVLGAEVYADIHYRRYKLFS